MFWWWCWAALCHMVGFCHCGGQSMILNTVVRTFRTLRPHGGTLCHPGRDHSYQRPLALRWQVDQKCAGKMFLKGERGCPTPSLRVHLPPVCNTLKDNYWICFPHLCGAVDQCLCAILLNSKMCNHLFNNVLHTENLQHDNTSYIRQIRMFTACSEKELLLFFLTYHTGVIERARSTTPA